MSSRARLAAPASDVAVIEGPRGNQLPASYEPKKGLKAMAVAEAAEIHFRRAKDAAGLFAAVAAKLTEQRKFVLWYDQQRAYGGDRRSLEFQDGRSAILKPAAFGVDASALKRWRQGLKEQSKFDQTLDKAKERCVKVCESGKGQSDYARLTNTGEEEWYTPDRYLEAARAVLGGFDLDPASSARAQERVRAGRFFTREEDGREQEWRGRVWLNPPYSFPAIEQFARKLAEEYQAGRVTAAIMLTNNSTETEWFQAAAGVCASLCFPTPRIKFISSRTGEEDSSPLQGQAFFYFGEDVDRFFAEFSPFGFVVEVLENG